MVVFCGIDWAEHHHDVAIVDTAGQVVAKRRISDDIGGFTQLTELLCARAERPADVQVALETDRGLLVAALRAAGYRVFAINPKAVDRYRDRYAVSGGKSDAADALVLANLLRTDAARHRELANDSAQVGAIAVLARAHQDAVRVRLRDTGRLRSLLREFFPAALTAFPNLATKTALTVLAAAPTPVAAGALTPEQIRHLLRAAGRVGVRASEVERLHQAFTAEQLRQPAAVEQAMGVAVQAIVTTLTATQTAIADLEAALATRFDNHPDAEILRSLPGLGVVLGGRVLGEFGDDPTRFLDAASRRRYAGTAPVTRASGKSRVVLLRRARNQRLADACRWWAFNAIQHSPGAMAYYRRRRAAGDTHEAALRRLGSKLVGQLHHCLEHREPYREDIAWPTSLPTAA
ncbi:transposase IS116/IS110/IS902 family protein [Kribbella antiqua]|uniref:Transposase IS116/IS110/IS902 family protein n=1 Tax=Kribbella antiqua TaxID=2512217 RepID=A0A4R2ILQ1_9ACTN|nr:transposase IS116/IS110/IS902 family protein [Kribbella antiqua]